MATDFSAPQATGGPRNTGTIAVTTTVNVVTLGDTDKPVAILNQGPSTVYIGINATTVATTGAQAQDVLTLLPGMGITLPPKTTSYAADCASGTSTLQQTEVH